MLGVYQLQTHAGLFRRPLQSALWYPIQRVYVQPGHPTSAYDGRSTDGMVQQHVLGGDLEDWTLVREGAAGADDGGKEVK